MNKASRWLIIWGVWTFVALFFAFGEAANQPPDGRTVTGTIFAREFIDDYLWFAFTPLVLILVARYSFLESYKLRSLVVHVFASAGVSLIQIAVLTLAYDLAGVGLANGNFGERFSVTFSANFQIGLIYYWAILAVNLIVTANRRRKEEMQKGDAAVPETAEQIPVHSEKLQRIPIKGAGRITFIETADVDWLEADDNYVRVHAGQRSHLVRDTLGRLGSQLDNSRFLRIHRSAIVNTSRIKELRPMPGGTYQVVMSGGNIVRSGRSYRENIALLLGNNHSPQKANASPQKC